MDQNAMQRVLQRVGHVAPPANLGYDSDLYVFDQLITESKHPEDLFGFEDIVLPRTILLDYLEKEYEAIKSVVDPGNYSDIGSKDKAEELSDKLEQLYALGKARINQQVFGISGYDRTRPTWAKRSISVGQNTVYVGPRTLENESYSLYQGYLDQDGQPSGDLTIKLANSAADNDGVKNEVRILDELHKVEVTQWKHLPCVLGKFEADGRVGVLFRKLPGMSVSEIRQLNKHKAGISEKHVVWFLKRTFSLLGYVHSQGVVHGNIVPDNMIVHARPHNIFLRNWENSVLKPAITGERIETFLDVYTAPEVKDGGRIGPWSDIYSVGKVMIWALGGNPMENSIPDEVESLLKDYLFSLVVESETSRPQDAWELNQEICDIKDELWPGEGYVNLDIS